MSVPIINESDLYWTDHDGNVLYLPDMTTSHIKNCMKFLMKKKNLRRKQQIQITIFAQELQERDRVRRETIRIRRQFP